MSSRQALFLIQTENKLTNNIKLYILKPFILNTHYKQILADTVTPVSIYFKIRDKFPNSLLLESSDYHGNDNSFSYICCNPIATIKIENEVISKTFPDGTSEKIAIDNLTNIPQVIQEFSSQFKSEKTILNSSTTVYLAIFLMMPFVTSKKFQLQKRQCYFYSRCFYAVYQNIIAINHFKNEAYIFCHSVDGKNNIAEIEQLLQSRNIASYKFSKEGEGFSNLTDEEFKANVALAKKHCYRGDVFQLVLSRRFTQGFKGDEFNVYRALRSINPSPYLFFFDYGDFKIFGSSPEAQIIVKNRKAEIHPIAGTFKRTGNDERDALLAKELSEDKKKTANTLC